MMKLAVDNWWNIIQPLFSSRIVLVDRKYRDLWNRSRSFSQPMRRPTCRVYATWRRKLTYYRAARGSTQQEPSTVRRTARAILHLTVYPTGQSNVWIRPHKCCRYLPQTGSTDQREETWPIAQRWPRGSLFVWCWIWTCGTGEQDLSGKPGLDQRAAGLPRWTTSISHHHSPCHITHQSRV